MSADYSAIMDSLGDAVFAKVEMMLSPAQKEAIAKHIYSGDMAPGDIPDAKKTSFFFYEELDDEMVEAIWEYGLSGSDLEDEVANKDIIPFAAMNTDGRRLAYGSNEFQDTRNWGVLCLDLKKGRGTSCPVLWIYIGERVSWAESSSITYKVLEAAPSDDEE